MERESRRPGGGLTEGIRTGIGILAAVKETIEDTIQEAVERGDLSPERAAAVTTGFPDPEHCERFGADVATVARFHDATAPIAAARGLRWSWTLEDPTEAWTRFVVVRDDVGGETPPLE